MLKGRPGAARLAKATGAPVVPVGLWGTERVWPRSAKVPRLVTINPPRVVARVGPPVSKPTTERIMGAIADLLPPDSKVARTPTEAELRATYPGGRIPD